MQRTKIDYLTHSWNPLAMRCRRVSEACANCWHLRMCKRHAANPHFTDEERTAYTGEGLPVLRQNELTAPLRLRKSARIGVQFMGDLFHLDVSYYHQEQIWDVMEATPQHTYLVLTKRPENMLTTLDNLQVSHSILPNVWLGVTAENQQRADGRIPTLLQCPAAKRFVSIEPMLGPVKIRSYLGLPNVLYLGRKLDYHRDPPYLDLVIAGGESGPGARPTHPDWLRSIRDQCGAAGVPFYFKQWGEWLHNSQVPPVEKQVLDGSPSWARWLYQEAPQHQWSDGTISYRVTKKMAGHLLDGKEYHEWPT